MATRTLPTDQLFLLQPSAHVDSDPHHTADREETTQVHEEPGTAIRGFFFAMLFNLLLLLLAAAGWEVWRILR